MTIDEEQLILSFLLAESPCALPARIAETIEALGAPAFDYVEKLLGEGALPPAAKVSALRLMTRISRIMCTDRKPILLERAMTLMNDSQPLVRASAMHVGIGAFIALIGNRALAKIGRAHEEALRVALSHAVERGEAPVEMVERFLARKVGADLDDLQATEIPSSFVVDLSRDVFSRALLCMLRFGSFGSSKEDAVIISGYECLLHFVDGAARYDFEVEVHFIGQRDVLRGGEVAALVAFADPKRAPDVDVQGSKIELRTLGSIVAVGVISAVARR